MRPVAFLDTETTGRDRFRRPWEIAIIRRDHTDERAVTIFVALAVLSHEIGYAVRSSNDSCNGRSGMSGTTIPEAVNR